jgi:hypothetical protein
MTAPMGRFDIRAWRGTVDLEVLDVLPSLLDRMITAWLEPDQQGRVDILEGCLAATATYTTPLAAAEGIDSVAALIGQIRSQYPGAVPARTTGVDLHHRHARYGWAMSDGTHQSPVRGINIITLDEAPLIQSVTSFLGPLPRVTYTYGAPE